MSRAHAFLLLLDEFLICEIRSNNEKTLRSRELKQVLDRGTELASVTRCARVPSAKSVTNNDTDIDDATLQALVRCS
jgi:hypothetical protein